MRGKTQYYKEKHFIRKAEVISSPCLEPPGVYWPYTHSWVMLWNRHIVLSSCYYLLTLTCWWWTCNTQRWGEEQHHTETNTWPSAVNFIHFKCIKLYLSHLNSPAQTMVTYRHFSRVIVNSVGENVSTWKLFSPVYLLRGRHFDRRTCRASI